MICPTCKRTFDANEGPNAERPRPVPFCSPRCRLADLGNWLDGSYRVPTATDDQDLDPAPSADKPRSDSDPLN